jgi:di/tripeptidase
MKDFVIKQLQSLGFKYMVDAVGNISAVRGKADTYPMLNAHMDIVYSIDNKRINVPQHTYKTTYSSKSCNNCENEYDCAYLMRENEQITLNEAYKRLATRKTCESYVSWSNYYDNDSYFSSYVYDEDRPKIESQITDLHKINFDSKTGKLSNNKIRVLGGDDKCGIALALQVAREMPKQPLKILFTVQEETGGQGIEYFIEHNKNWFNDVKYCLTLDRRGSDNLILHACGQKLCERAFGSKIAKIGIETGIEVDSRVR